MVDVNIAKQAYVTAMAEGASPKVILALFEAGLVESNFTNPTVATDHDSLGYLQQRPSQGWPNPNDVVVATKSFLNKAKEKEKAGFKGTAGQLAQAVQISAFPEKYDKREAEAKKLLLQVMAAPDVVAATAKLKLGGNLTDTLKQFLKYASPAGTVLDAAGNVIEDIPGMSQITKFFTNIGKKETWVAFTFVTVGVLLVIFALIKLTGDNQLGEGTKKLASKAKDVALMVATRKPSTGASKAGAASKVATSARAASAASAAGKAANAGKVAGLAKGSSTPIKAGANVAKSGTIK